MAKINYKNFKAAFPYICNVCGCLLWEYREVCEGCGQIGFVRDINKKDYKKWQNSKK